MREHIDFEALIQALGQPVFVLDPKAGAIVEANEAAATILGFSRDELRTMRIADIHPFEMDRFEAFAREVLETGNSRARGLTCRDRTGIFIPAEITASRLDVGEHACIVALVHDLRTTPAPEVGDGPTMAEYRRLQDQLATAQHLLDHAPEMVLWVTPEGRLTYANRTAAELLGYQRSRLQQMHIWDVDTESTPETFADHVPTYRQHGRMRMERRMQSADGTVFPVTVTVQLIRHGNEETIVSFSRDISEEVHARDEARRYLGELARVSRQASVSEIASAVSHEINQPLTAILTRCRACLRILEQEDFPDLDRLRQAINDTHASAERATGVVARLHRYIRSGEPQRRVVDAGELVEECVSLLRAQARHASVKLDVEIDDDLPPVYVDSVLVQQVVLNLARNGIDAMLEHGSAERRLDVRAWCDEDERVTVAVADSGPGIGDEQAVRIFEPFFSTKGGGLGIGLSLCRSIIDSHQGQLWVERGTAPGAEFRFMLPAAEREPDTDAGQPDHSASV